VRGRLDFSESIARIKANPVDVIYLPGDSQTTKTQIEQLRSQGIKSTFLGIDAWNQSHITKMPIFEGAYLTDHWHTSVNQQNTSSLHFFNLYKKRFQEEPNIVSMLTFDSINILLKAIGKGSTKSESIQAELIKTRNFEGVTGRISFSDHGETNKPVFILQVRDGKIHFVEEVYSK
jgi:branched-chain amino acid transport system substrate-binding protein